MWHCPWGQKLSRGLKGGKQQRLEKQEETCYQRLEKGKPFIIGKVNETVVYDNFGDRKCI